MDADITIKEELDICDYEFNAQEITSSRLKEHQPHTNDYKMMGVQSDEPFGIFNEERDMITVNVGSLQSEEERDFIANIDLKKIFADTNVTNVCIFCQKSFNNFQSFLDHKKKSICQYFWQQPYLCSLCALVFESQHKLVKHCRLHQRNMHFCQMGCGKFFRKVECSLEHEFRDHSGKDRKFKCRFCSLTLVSSNQLIQHVGSVHAYVYRYVCSICRRNFESGEELKNHWLLSRSTCGLIVFDDHSHMNGELVGIKAIDNKQKVEESEIQVKPENDAWDSELVNIKVEPMLEGEDEGEMENVKLKIKQEPVYETDHEIETDFKTNNTLDLPSIQYTNKTLDISKLRLPSLPHGKAKAVLVTPTGQKKTTEINSNQTGVGSLKKNQGIKVAPLSNAKSLTTPSGSANLKALTTSAISVAENSENVENFIKYFKVVPLQTIKQASTSNCNTSVEINENGDLTKTEGDVKLNANGKRSGNHLKMYNVYNLPANAKIIRLGNLKASPPADNNNGSAFKTNSSPTSSVISSIPKNIKIVKLSPGKRVNAPASSQSNSQISKPQTRRNFCFTNDTMSYIEALPEARKVIEEFKNKIKSIEQNPSESEHESNCSLTKEFKSTPKPQQSKPENALNASVPSSLFLPFDEDNEKRLIDVRRDHPHYRFSWMCPKCPRQYELKYHFHTHLTSAHGMTKDELKQLHVEVKPQQKEKRNNLKMIDALPLQLSLDSESDKKINQVRWAHPDYRFSWSCPKCPRQYELKYAFRAHLRGAHGMSQDEYSSLQFSIRPFKMLNPMKVKTNSKEKKVEPIVSASKAVLPDKESIVQAISKDDADAKPSQSKGSRPRQYECSVCFKRFSASGTLNCHMSIHTGELPHKCDYCDKRFRTRGQVTVHHRTHTGERPFTCQVCSLGFTHRETLISHLSRHIGMKRYKCYGCDKTFSCISGLRTHRDVRPDTCGLVKFSPRAIGPRVRVVRGNVIFEQQPKDNPYLRSDEPPEANQIVASDHAINSSQ